MNHIEREDKVNKIVNDIKSIKIQGARNIAKASLKAYYLSPKKSTLKKLINSRPTEPMMHKVLKLANKKSENEILKHFDYAQDEINKNLFKIIKNNSTIFVHCHSTNVVNALIYAKKHGKKFQVYNTETRPLFQGRKTSKELSKAGIKVTGFVDSAARIALLKESKNDKIHADIILLGADAILKKGVINKIGSGMFSEIAYNNKIPVYIVADSWKFSSKNLPLERRKLNEIWDKAPKSVKIENPAFEFVPKRFIKKIISDLGILSLDDFVRKITIL